jgi:hypothetical protein
MALKEILGFRKNAQSAKLQLLKVVAPALLTLASLIGILAASGVTLAQSATYLAYEAVYILVPGWLCYFTFGDRNCPFVKQIAVGWGVGYALETLASIAFSACGKSRLFWTYPILILALLIWICWVRFRDIGWAKVKTTFHLLPDVRFQWMLSFFAVLALLYLALFNYTINPLPWASDKGVTYYADVTWAMGTTAEAKHHWPITDPRISGQPISYYTFVYTHLATISRTTGLSVPVIVLRMFPAIFDLVFALQLFVLGMEISGSYLLGILTISLTIFVGQINPFFPIDDPFQNVFLYDTYYSCTYAFGLLFFVPLLIIALDLLRETKLTTHSLGSWGILSLLLIGIGGAKAAALLVFTAASIGFFVWRLWRERQLHLPSLLVLLFAGNITWFYLHFIYGKQAAISHFFPFAAINYIPFIHYYLPWVFSPNSNLLLSIFGTFVALIGNLNLRFVAVLWLILTRGLNFSLSQAWLIALFAAGVGPWLFFDDEVSAGSFFYFLFYGYVAASALSAEVLVELWQKARKWSIKDRIISYTLIGFLLFAGVVDYPFQQGRRFQHAWDTAYLGVNKVPDLTPQLLQALEWVRSHTRKNEVLAVNNQFLYGNQEIPRYFYYSALSERRVFLEGWYYSDAFHTKQSRVYLDRLKINQRVFEEGDAAAARIMAEEFGVTHLLVDKIHGASRGLLAKFAALVYCSPEVEIYAISYKD